MSDDSNTNEDKKEDGLGKLGLKIPHLKEPSEGRSWWIKAVNAVLNIPMETARSYLIPGKGELYFFLYRTYWKGEKFPGMDIYAFNYAKVFAKVTAKLPDLEIIDVKKSEGKPIFPDLPLDFKFNPNYYGYDSEVGDILHSVFPELTKRYQSGQAGTLGKLYLYLLKLTVNKSLLPYYEALNPDFFAWCKKAENIQKKSYHFHEGKIVEDPE